MQWGAIALFVGVIDQIELQPAGQRVTLREVDIKDLPRDATPARIRVKTVVAQPELRIGQKVGGVATLSAPAGPAEPGAFNFRRQAFFDDLGATGFGYGRLKILKEPEDTRFGGVAVAQMERRFEYDARGNLIKQWDARDNLTQYA